MVCLCLTSQYKGIMAFCGANLYSNVQSSIQGHRSAGTVMLHHPFLHCASQMLDEMTQLCNIRSTSFCHACAGYHWIRPKSSTVLLSPLVCNSECCAGAEAAAGDRKIRADYAGSFSADDVKKATAGSSLVPDNWPAPATPGSPARLSHVGRPTHGQHYGNRLALIIDDDEVASLVVAQCVEPLGYKVKAPLLIAS